MLVDDRPLAGYFAKAHREADAFWTRFGLASDEQDCMGQGYVGSRDDAKIVQIKAAGLSE